MSSCLAHPADLPVQSLCQHNAEGIFPQSFDAAGLRLHFKVLQPDSLGHLVQILIADLPPRADNVLLLMLIGRAHHCIDQSSVVGHQKKALRIAVQPSRIGQMNRIAEHLFQRHLRMRIRFRHRHADRLVIRHNHLAVLGMNDLIPHLDFLSARHHGSGLRDLVVYSHLAHFHQAVGLSSRIQTGGSDELVETDPAVLAFFPYRFTSCAAAFSFRIHLSCSMIYATVSAGASEKVPNSFIARMVFSNRTSSPAEDRNR